MFHDIWIRFENYKSFKSQIMLGTNLRCLDNLNGIWGFDTSNTLQTTSYIQLHQQTLLACPTSAYTCIYMKISKFVAVFRHSRAMQTFMDHCGPWQVYAPCGHISSLFSMFYFSYFFPKRLYYSPYHRQSHDRLSPSSHHHVWLHPPIFSCLVNILLLFVRIISP